MIPALKDKSIEVLFFTFRTLKMRQIGGRYSDYGIAAIFVNIRVKSQKSDTSLLVRGFVILEPDVKQDL